MDFDDSNIDYSNQDDFYSNTGNQPMELEFQEFDVEETDNIPPITDIDNNNDNNIYDEDNITEENTTKRNPGEGKLWNISYYQKFANVDSLDVGKRIALTFLPIKDFFEFIGDNPDLYGWFWISTTLVFILAAAGNFASYVTFAIADDLDDWSYDFKKLGFGAMLVYLYVLFVPFLTFVAMKLWLEFKPSIWHHFCIIGYSLFPYIPASIIMIIPFPFIRWITVGIACIIVCIFLIRNYIPLIKGKPMEGGAVLLVLIIINIIFALILVFFFFQYSVVEHSSDESSTESSTDSSNLSSSLSEYISSQLTSSSSIISSYMPSSDTSNDSSLTSESSVLSTDLYSSIDEETISSSLTSSISITPSISISESSSISITPSESEIISPTPSITPSIEYYVSPID